MNATMSNNCTSMPMICVISPPMTSEPIILDPKKTMGAGGVLPEKTLIPEENLLPAKALTSTTDSEKAFHFSQSSENSPKEISPIKSVACFSKNREVGTKKHAMDGISAVHDLRNEFVESLPAHTPTMSTTASFDSGSSGETKSFSRKQGEKRVRFCEDDEVKLIQKLTMTDIRGDWREPDTDPDFCSIGQARHRRLSQFAEKMRARKLLLLWGSLAKAK
mmetsp:Transcript_5509/g.7684  ORF Transcript_5509/g.7684 Transcript_5509/m.7684 type:complete len:220 (-) Transcript_5509:345-1004(-)